MRVGKLKKFNDLPIGNGLIGDGLIVECNCTPQVQLYDVVFNSDLNLVDCADASQSQKTPVMGIVIQKINEEQVKVMLQGEVSGFSALSLGLYFLDAIPGKMTPFAPIGSGNIVQVLGRAITPTRLIFEPAQTCVQLA